jgi:hypothetical protein
VAQVREPVVERSHRDQEDDRRPLGAYAVLAGIFNAGFGGALLYAARRGKLPERVPLLDVALIGAATFKLSRLIAKDAVTGFVRAPFVRFEGMSGITEPEEEPRGHGIRMALGQLLLCPQCTGLWVAAGLTTAMLSAPRPTRVVTSAVTALGVSDFLNLAYSAASAATEQEASS